MTLLHPGETFPNLAVTPIDGAALSARRTATAA